MFRASTAFAFFALVSTAKAAVVLGTRAMLVSSRARSDMTLAVAQVRFQEPVLSQPKFALMPLIIPGIRTISDATLFPVVNLVLPAWLLLIFLPNSKITKSVVKYTALAFAALYCLLMVPMLSSSGGAGFGTCGPSLGATITDVGSLKGITALFAQESAVMVGWVHYVVFDLWTAQFIVNDSRKMYVDRVGNMWKVPHFAVVPCLLATMLAGPAGLLGYYLMRAAFTIYRKSSFIKRASNL
jgi:hypothetical protein